MRPLRAGRLSPDHQEAVSRRLAQLTADLAAGRERAGDDDDGPAGDVRPGGAVGAVGAASEPWWVGHTVPSRDDAGQPRRPAPTAAVRGPGAVPEPALVRAPGRHAARRSRVPVAESEAWTRARVLLGPAQVAVLALVVAVGLAATTWWVLGSRPDEMAPVAAPVEPGTPLVAGPTGTPAAPGSPGADATAEAVPVDDAEGVTVDVAGKVRRPGIAVLPAGSRVVDALEAAGGARPGVDLAGLNLARVLVDGEQIVVGAPATAPPTAPPTAPAPSGTSTGTGVPATLVNINTALQPELETLPEVGPVTAQAILGWRDQNGGFTAIEELLEVDGIGDATLAQITPYVTV